MSFKRFLAIHSATTLLLTLAVWFFVVGGGSTHPFDIFFGIQLITLIPFALGLTILGLLTHNKAFLKATVTTVVAISIYALVIFLPASHTLSSRFYYKGTEGGPAGPSFACLIWERQKPFDTPLYNFECTLLHLPSLNAAYLNTQTTYRLKLDPYYFLFWGTYEALFITGLYLIWSKMKVSQSSSDLPR